MYKIDFGIVLLRGTKKFRLVYPTWYCLLQGWVQDYIRKIASTYSTSVHQYNRIGTGQYKLDYTVHTAEYTTKKNYWYKQSPRLNIWFSWNERVTFKNRTLGLVLIKSGFKNRTFSLVSIKSGFKNRTFTIVML